MFLFDLLKAPGGMVTDSLEYRFGVQALDVLYRVGRVMMYPLLEVQTDPDTCSGQGGRSNDTQYHY